MPYRLPNLPMPISGMLLPELEVSSILDEEEARTAATSKILAAQAQRFLGVAEVGEPGVVDFRRAHLPNGRLLAPDEVGSWVAAQATSDGAPDQTFFIAVHEEDVTWDKESGKWILGHEGGPLRVSPHQFVYFNSAVTEPHPSRLQIEYAVPGWPPVAVVGVRVGGVLDALRRLSDALAARTRWPPAYAATFVLTGLIPYADEFVFVFEGKLARRPRAMSGKHMELAVFTAEHEGETLADRLKAWNTIHPEWSYKTVEHFGGDSRLAVRRLAGEGVFTDGNR